MEGLESKDNSDIYHWKIRKMFLLMTESSKKLVPYLKDICSENNGDVDLQDALGRFAMDVISSTAFGIESQTFNSADSIVAKMAKKLALNIGAATLLKFVAHVNFPKIFSFRLLDKEAEDFFSKVITDSIKHRETTGEKRNDFLQLLIDLKHGKLKDERENKETDLYEKDAPSDEKKSNTLEIDDKIIVANCLLFIFAGFETTQSGLIFGAYSLALNKDIQDKLRNEMINAMENNEGELSYDIVTQNEYLDKVVNETLRMYPPTLRTERICTKDYNIPNSNAVIPKDSYIAMSVYHIIHHDEKHFRNPKLFDPERFSNENKASRSSYAFMPFGHGPRSCIASRFALTETKALFANLVLNFEIEPCAKTTIPMAFSSGTLKPVNGMWLNLKPLYK